MVRGIALGVLLLAVSGGLVSCGEDEPDLSTPEGFLAEYKRALNERDWQVYWDLHTPENRGSMLIGILMAGFARPDIKAALTSARNKYARTDLSDGSEALKAAFEDPEGLYTDPEAFFVEASDIVVGSAALDFKMMGFEDLKVDGDRAEAKKVMKYAAPAVMIDREPIHMVRKEGAWFATLRMDSSPR